jgi:hypothetical protein
MDAEACLLNVVMLSVATGGFSEPQQMQNEGLVW